VKAPPKGESKEGRYRSFGIGHVRPKKKKGVTMAGRVGNPGERIIRRARRSENLRGKDEFYCTD